MTTEELHAAIHCGVRTAQELSHWIKNKKLEEDRQHLWEGTANPMEVTIWDIIAEISQISKA